MRIIGGAHKGRRLIIPKGVDLRPTFSRLKQTLFDICAPSIAGATFLDLFAGIGGVGIEAISRGAKQVIFVEIERRAALGIRSNLALIGEERKGQVQQADVFETLQRLARQGKKFDLIFADPPYGTLEKSLSDEVLKFVDAHSLLNPGGELFLEDDAKAYDRTLVLTTLKLKSSREIGHALLRQYH